MILFPKPAHMSDDDYLKTVAPRVWLAHHAPPVPTWWPRLRSEHGYGAESPDANPQHGQGMSLESSGDRELRWRWWYADYRMQSDPYDRRES